MGGKYSEVGGGGGYTGGSQKSGTAPLMVFYIS